MYCMAFWGFLILFWREIVELSLLFVWKFPISLSGLEMVEVCGHGGRWGGSVFENKGRVWVKVETKSEDSSLSVLIYYVCIRISNTKLPHTQHKIIYPSRIPTNLPVLRIQVKQKTDRLGTIHVQSPPSTQSPSPSSLFCLPAIALLAARRGSRSSRFNLS